MLISGFMLAGAGAVIVTAPANADLTPQQDAVALSHFSEVVTFVDDWSARHDQRIPTRKIVARHFSANPFDVPGGWVFIPVTKVGYCIVAAVYDDGSRNSTSKMSNVRWYDSVTTITSQPTRADITGKTEPRGACTIWAQRQRAQDDPGIIDSLASDLKNTATAVETYFTDHPTATAPRPTMQHLRRHYGLRTTANNAITLRGGWNGYCIRATAPNDRLKGNRAVWYDSDAGGVQTSRIKPTGDGFACARLF